MATNYSFTGSSTIDDLLRRLLAPSGTPPPINDLAAVGYPKEEAEKLRLAAARQVDDKFPEAPVFAPVVTENRSRKSSCCATICYRFSSF